MTNEQLNRYIEHYLDKDKTRRAIMLTGAWGIGKSYYISNSLSPYLKRNKKDCIVISLYGIKDITEISKAIYIELRSIKLLRSNEKTQTVKIIGKTILKNITQYIPAININTEISKNDLQELYESINLDGKLIIFEDIERSNIDIVEFLGYVNNLTENDGVKILLVANEEEILRKDCPIDMRTNIEKQEDRIFSEFSRKKEIKTTEDRVSESAKKYILIKEKTVTDTIIFNCDYQKAIRDIIKLFCNDKLNKYLNIYDIRSIGNIIYKNDGNLRSFLFACQKTIDIFEQIKIENDEVRKCIFFSIINFSFIYKNKGKINWEGNEEFSLTLGDTKYPLFRCCYEYIINHYMDIEEFNKIQKYYKKFKQYNSNDIDNDNIQILYSYSEQRDIELEKAINGIEKDLQEKNIPFMAYGKLAKCLVVVSEILEIDITEIKQLLIDNISGKINQIDTYLLFIHEELNEEEISKQYIDLKKEMLKSMEYSTDKNSYSFDYNSKKIKEFKNKIIEKRYKINYNIDNKLLVEMIKKSYANEINDIRLLYLLEKSIVIKLIKDTNNLKALIKLLKEAEKEWSGELMAKKMVSYFIKDLERALMQLEKF